MSALAGGLLTLAGLVVAGLALRDVFRTLWYPTGTGTLSVVVARLVWRAGKHLGRGAHDLAGPVILVAVVVTWAALVVLGAAFVYWPRLVEDGFSYGTGLDPDARSSFVDALYVSAVVLGTLGLGDIVPVDGWLRILVALQGLIGFSLLTAAVSWVLQVQSALARRRSAARFVHALRRADAGDDVPSRTVLERLTADVATVHADLDQTSMTYWFRDEDHDGALATALPHAAELARRGTGGDDPDVRAAARGLDAALDDLAALLDRQFLHVGGDRGTVLHRYVEDQRHER
ncbi:potassium channel family protein [Cellulomonas sp. NPDC057328]|uniref:potassium channel family protein n=1 Tax=Cellulomonas sp. NPDC057328 TaxID=3346101 RepID=UPI003627B039